MKNNYNSLPRQVRRALPIRQILTLSTAFFLIFLQPASAQRRNSFLNQNSTSWGFVKNEGQLNSTAAYYGNLGNLQVFFYPDKLEFIARKHRTIKEEQPQSVISKDINNNDNETAEITELLFAKMQMNFQDYDASKVKLQASAKSECANNFFLNGRQILNVPTYDQIKYINIYPQIDLIFKADANGLKYEFEIRPGGKVSDIKLHWQGADILLKDGSLTYENMLGKLRENKPVSYISTGEKMLSSFQLKNNTITFKTGKYPASKTLIIDPLMRWSTYFGGDSTEGAKDVAVDSKGNVYIVGATTSHSNIATSGSYRDTIAYPTTADVFLAKFSPDGKRIWSTYYGGSSLDYGYSVTIDKNDDVYIGGLTGSTDLIATTGVHQTTNSGGGAYNHEGFLAKFDSSGNLEWGTYYGGSRVDAIMSLTCDKFGDIYAAGYTKSSNNIASANAHRTLFAGGGTGNTNIGGDAFLAKFNPANGKLKWGTYYGGAGEDYALAVTTDAKGNPIIGGQAGSSTLIATTGSHQENRGGTSFNYDGFIAKFDSSGALQWGTYFGGAMDDHIAAVSCDSKNNIYITGTTLSADNISTSGAFKENKSDLEDMFLACFDADGNRKWGTYFGSDGFDMAKDISISPAAEVFFTGVTDSYDLATSNAEKQNFADVLDVITGNFDTSGNLTWASYFGGEGSDFVEAMAVQDKSTFYLTGYTSSTVEIAVIGAHQEIRGGFGDAFLIKYDTLGFCYGLAAPGISGDTVICKNATTSYTTFYNPLYAYNWEVDGGKILLGEFSDSVVVKWENSGKRSLRIVRITEYGCTDSSEIMVDVKDLPVADFNLPASICLNEPFTFTTNTTATNISWYFDDGTTSTQKTVAHTYKKAGMYDVKLLIITPEGCADSMSKVIVVEESPNSDFSISKVSGFTYNFIADDTTYTKYTWQINGVNKYTKAKVAHNFGSTGTYKVTLITENANGCINSKSDSITIEPNSINNQANNTFQFDVYPNPFHNQSNINIFLDKKANISMGLYDANGRYIPIAKNALVAPGNHQFKVDAEELGLKAGLYLLYININDAAFTQKLVRLE